MAHAAFLRHTEKYQYIRTTEFIKINVGLQPTFLRGIEINSLWVPFLMLQLIDLLNWIAYIFLKANA